MKIIKELFDKNGYYIAKNIFNKSDMSSLFFMFYDISYSTAKRNKIKISSQLPSPNNVIYPNDMKKLDKLMLEIFNFNKDLIGEIYDTISYTSVFLRFTASKKIEKISKILLGVKKNTHLYGFTNRIRIDPPNDERRTYGWHQEIFYTLPKSKFVQTWCPILRDTTKQNGTIEIKPFFHKEGITKQTWNEFEGRATQIIIDPRILNKYKTLQLEMQVGDLLYFDGHLAHQSGNNNTKDEIRFSMVGMWHNTSFNDFRVPFPLFKNRNIGAKEYFEEIMNKNNE